ncbi:MAG: type II secretion system protein GspC [Desulfuromonadales bacterium]|nr:type II secretion system protein GspC [Desulfuromonadales bacterium]
MMIYSSIQKYFREIYFLLVATLGLALGSLTATIVGGLIEPATTMVPTSMPAPTEATPRPELSSFDIILQRNLFQAAVGGAPATELAPARTDTAQTTSRRSDLLLVGVVVAGEHSLAVIRSGKDEELYRQGMTLPGNGTLDTVERHRVVISYADGTQTVLFLYKDAENLVADDLVPPSPDAGTVIKQVGDNRWVIPRDEAQQARGNLNELLKQARMEPLILDGKTNGFVVKMIRPRSLLALLGIEKGDLLKSVNGMALDGPEKALQIFQQLREANTITINLIRQGTPQTFEYAID